jgi:glycosyltransferase involved in cell wall biosynthesis
MLHGQEIVYIANDWVRDNKTSAHHVAEVLARDNRLLYVEGAGMRAPRPSARDLGKIARKLRAFFARPRAVADNMYLYSPALLPFHGIPAVRSINRRLLGRSLTQAVKTVGFTDPIVWVFMPHFAPALKAIHKKGLVYYCVDDYASQPLVDPDVIRAMEREILVQADVVFAVSEELVADKSRTNENTYLSRHGVDTALFARAADPATEVPADVAALPHPVAGYFGLIEEWIDMDLVEHLARSMPHVSFAYIGRVVHDTSRFDRYDNVHFLGPRQYHELPGYLKAFDAAMLLYRSGGFAKHANPKKLREYLAGGKPVVSVRLGEVERYSNVVRIADTYDEYVECLFAALEDDSPEATAARRRAVESESWEAKVERLGEIVARHIALDRGAEGAA